MTFIPENTLEEALLKATQDPLFRPGFYEILIHSEIFLIQTGDVAEDNGPIELEEGDEFQLSTIEINGQEHIPIFSSSERIYEVIQEGYGYVTMNILDLIEMTNSKELVLNPGGEISKEFTKEEINFILTNSPSWETKPVGEKAPQKVIIGEPEKYPHELTKKLSQLFITLKEVKRAWIANIMVPGEDEKPHSLVALEVSDNIEEIVNNAANLSNNMDLIDPPVDYLQITGEGGLEDYFIEESQPFYTKKE
jgi:SseB protein C-terminal domain/SseB protein N-terminal domain